MRAERTRAYPLRLAPLLLLPLVLVACGGVSQVRQPSSKERAQIVAVVAGDWAYESAVRSVREKRHLRGPHLSPRVASIRISRSNPPFASAAVELLDAHGRRRPGTIVVIFRRVVGKELAGATEPWERVAATGTAFPLPCAAAAPAGVRDLICPDPWSVLRYPRPQIRLNTEVEIRLRSPDLRAVNWDHVDLPGAACGAKQPIRLRHGRAFVHSAADPWWSDVEVDSGSRNVSYGDLDGDGRDEAAVGVSCGDGRGTSAGHLEFASVIFTARAGFLRVVGIITPRQPFDPSASHVPTLGRVQIRLDEVIAPEGRYGPRDGDCCPSGRARTIWTYANAELHPGRTVIEQRPRR